VSLAADAVLTLRIPRLVASPNADRGAHWATRHATAKLWEQEIWIAWHQSGGGWQDWVLDSGTPPERRRVTVTRACASRRSFCKDSDNRMFAAKAIRDGLVRLRLLVDDSDRWLESRVDEIKSADGRNATVIRIERLV
jgi:hypothetical protein